MKKRLGSNPLDSLTVKEKENLDYLEQAKARKWVEEIREKSALCIHLKRNGSDYFCESPMARQHGFLGNKEEMEQKCGKCHAKILK